MSISQKPFLNGLGSLSTMIIFLTLSLSIVTAAALDGSVKTLLPEKYGQVGAVPDYFFD